MFGLSKQEIRRSLWLVLVLVGVTVAMRWAVARNKAERLFDVPATLQARLIGIRGDQAYFLRIDPAQGTTVTARSLATRQERMIGQDRDAPDGGSLVMTEDALYYKVNASGRPVYAGGVSTLPGGGSPVKGAASKPARPDEPSGGMARFGDVPLPQKLSNPRQDGNSAAAAARWPVEGVGEPPFSNFDTGAPIPWNLRRMSLKTGKTEPVAATLPSSGPARRDFAVLGDYLYSARPSPDPPPSPWASLAERKKSTVTLWRHPVSGGSPQLFLRVPGLSSVLYAGRERLYWIVSRVDEPGKVELYHMAPGDAKMQRVRDFQSWLPPVVAGDRLYWVTRQFVRQDPKMAALTFNASDLVSSRLDGGDRRVVEQLTRAGENLRFLSRPLAYRDRAYVQVSDHLGDPDGMERREALFRIRTDLSGLDKELDLPNQSSDRGFIEDGWFYFTVSERRQGWLDYARDGNKLEYVDVLHRVKLPGVY